MTTPHPRTPVLIGVGQISNRDEPLEPADLMAEAVRRAAGDTGAKPDAVLGAADSVRVPLQLSWRYRDPGALVAARTGMPEGIESVYTVMGGNFVQTLVNRTALDLLEGRIDLAVLTGAEAWRTRSDARRGDATLPWTKQGEDVAPATPFGGDEHMSSPHEMERAIVLPVQVYPMFENGLRAADGIDRDTHLARVGALWSRFSEVAAGNPNAWIQQAFTADELVNPTPDNRMIGLPYTKRLNSNNMVDQGAALILTTVERAEELGVPRDRWVFVQAGTDAHDHWFLSERDELAASPAIRLAGAAALELAGIGAADLAHIDLYSCFPSAVQVAARELGLGTGVGADRSLTVTGGMSFAGGPWNNYTMHGIATMVDVLRADPGAPGLVTGNGGFLSKHAFGVYSTEPPAGGAYRWQSLQAEVDALPSRVVDTEPEGAATIETYTVMHERDGSPHVGLVALRMPDGRRAWVNTADADTIAGLIELPEPIGRAITVRSATELDLR